MTATRRLLAAQPALHLLLTTTTPPPALRRGLAVLAHPARPSRSPRTAAAAASPWSPPCLRRYSLGSAAGPDGVASRIWTFDQVKRQVEAQRSCRGDAPEGQQKVVFVDVREHKELVATGKIPGAVHLPLQTAPQAVERPDDADAARRWCRDARPEPRDAHLVFYCRAGVRAGVAAQLAARAGWPSVGEYPGSWLEWEERQGPVEAVGPAQDAARRPGRDQEP